MENGERRTVDRHLRLFRSRGRYRPRENKVLGKARWVSSLMNLGSWPEEYVPFRFCENPARM